MGCDTKPSGERTVAVEPDVPGEVVTGPKGHTDERSVRGEGSRGERGEGAVAACRAENLSVRAASGPPGILALLEETHFHAALAAPAASSSAVGFRHPIEG